MAMTLPTSPDATAGPAATTSDVNELARAHLHLVSGAVSELAGRLPRHVRRDDLISAGMLGLAQAAASYDPARGLPFDRFAKVRIRGALLDELRSRDWASRSVRALARRADAASESLAARLGRAPQKAEIAEALGVAVDDLHRLDADVHRAALVNFESVVVDGTGEGLLPADVEPAPDAALEHRERLGYLADAVLALPQRLRTVVIGYFFHERPMQDIADELGVTESRISQMRGEALELLRGALLCSLDPELLEPERRPDGRAARRRAAFFDAVAAASTPWQRLEGGGVAERAADLAAAGLAVAAA